MEEFNKIQIRLCIFDYLSVSTNLFQTVPAGDNIETPHLLRTQANRNNEGRGLHLRSTLDFRNVGKGGADTQLSAWHPSAIHEDKGSRLLVNLQEGIEIEQILSGRNHNRTDG